MMCWFFIVLPGYFLIIFYLLLQCIIGCLFFLYCLIAWEQSMFLAFVLQFKFYLADYIFCAILFLLMWELCCFMFSLCFFIVGFCLWVYSVVWVRSYMGGPLRPLLAFPLLSCILVVYCSNYFFACGVGLVHLISSFYVLLIVNIAVFNFIIPYIILFSQTFRIPKFYPSNFVLLFTSAFLIFFSLCIFVSSYNFQFLSYRYYFQCCCRVVSSLMSFSIISSLLTYNLNIIGRCAFEMGVLWALNKNFSAVCGQCHFVCCAAKCGADLRPPNSIIMACTSICIYIMWKRFFFTFVLFGWNICFACVCCQFEPIFDCFTFLLSFECCRAFNGLVCPDAFDGAWFKWWWV